MTGSYSALGDRDGREVFPAPLEQELQLARACASRAAAANMHDRMEMLRTAVALDHRLRTLIAAVEAERGGA